jgi:hypothetical protein
VLRAQGASLRRGDRLHAFLCVAIMPCAQGERESMPLEYGCV